MSKVKVDDLPKDAELTDKDLDNVSGGAIPLAPINPNTLIQNVPIAPGTNCGISVASNGGGPDIPVAPIVNKVRT